MLSLTAKFCCNRLPLRNSMLVTDTFGRLNLGVREQAARQSIQAASKPPAAAAAGTALFKMRRYAPMNRLYRKVPWASPMAQCAGVAQNTSFLKSWPGRLRRARWALAAFAISGIGLAAPPQRVPAETPAAVPAGCLESGDGYLRAHLGGAIEAKIDWPN